MDFPEKSVAELPQTAKRAGEPLIAAAAPADPRPPAVPGRPFVKGQSGNPRGRPSRAYKAAVVAQGMFDRKTTQLVDRAIGWGQGSDKSMLRLYVDRMVPRRTEVPVWLNLPAIENRRDLETALKAVATGVANGEIPSAQGLRLTELFTKMCRYL